MTSDEPYWDWMDSQLKQPSRAVGGEPCLVCGSVIESGAPWKYRDRHVCSGRCNKTLIRRWKKNVGTGAAPAFAIPLELVAVTSDEAQRAPRLFSTSQTAEFPYEHARFPVEGDVIERHGHHTAYVPLSSVPYRGTFADHVMRSLNQDGANALGVVHEESRAWTLWFRRPDGTPAKIGLGKVFVGDSVLPDSGPLPLAGGPIYLSREQIRDVDTNGEFTWTALTFSPKTSERLWAPTFEATSAQRTRINRARGSYLARQRAQGLLDADADRVDPFVIYERDNWTCQLCLQPIDRGLQWPNPWTATLDHIKPVSRQGPHSESNLQAAHWICNLQKGNGE